MAKNIGVRLMALLTIYKRGNVSNRKGSIDRQNLAEVLIVFKYFLSQVIAYIDSEIDSKSTLRLRD